VVGVPGPECPDLISIAVGRRFAIVAAPAAFANDPIVPFIIHNDGDVIDGNGAILTVPEGAATNDRTAIMVQCDDVTIRSLEFRDLQYGVIAVPVGPSWSISGLVVLQNKFRNVSALGVAVSAWSFGNPIGGEARDIRILGNRFHQSDGSLQAIQVSAAATNLLNQTSSGAVVEDVVIAGNRVMGGNAGIGIAGGISTDTTEIDGAVARNVRIEGNVISGVFDASIIIMGGASNRGGEVRSSGLEEIWVHGNIVTDTPGTPVWASGGSIFQQPGGLVDGNFIDGLHINYNRVQRGEFCKGIAIYGGWMEWAEGGAAVNNTSSNISIQGNRIDANCSTGIVIGGGTTFSSAGIVFGNLVEDVAIRYNDIRNVSTGVSVQAGFALEFPENLGGYAIPDSFDTIGLRSFVIKNEIHRVEIEANTIRNTKFPLVVSGAMIFEAPDVARENKTEAVSAFDNIYIDNESAYDCSFYDELLIGDEGGEVIGNTVSVLCDWAFE
jgi:hypothetical protein